jgi:hypothetical protein
MYFENDFKNIKDIECVGTCRYTGYVAKSIKLMLEFAK